MLCISMQQAILDLEVAAGGKRLAVDLEIALAIERIKSDLPAVADLLLLRASRKVQPRLIEVIAQAVHTGAPDQYRRRIRDAAKARIAFAQRLLGCVQAQQRNYREAELARARDLRERLPSQMQVEDRHTMQVRLLERGCARATGLQHDQIQLLAFGGEPLSAHGIVDAEDLEAGAAQHMAPRRRFRAVGTDVKDTPRGKAF